MGNPFQDDIPFKIRNGQLIKDTLLKAIEEVEKGTYCRKMFFDDIEIGLKYAILLIDASRIPDDTKKGMKDEYTRMLEDYRRGNEVSIAGIKIRKPMT